MDIINKKRFGIPVCWNMLWIMLFFTGLGILFIVMPKYTDDYWYMIHLRPWFEAQGINLPAEGGNIFRAGIPWDGIWSTWVERYYTDNIRIANLVVLFFLLFPKWVGSGLMTLCWIYTVFACFRLSGIDWRKSALIPVSVFLWTFCMPWAEDMGCMDYQFNYLLTTFAAMLLVICLFRECSGTGIINKLLYFIFGLIVGMMHEGVSVPFAGGIVAMIVCFKDWRKERYLITLAGMVGGIILLMTIPGMVFRFATTVEVKTLLKYSFLIRIEMLSFVLYVLLLLSDIVLRGIRGVIKNPDKVVVFSLAGSAVSFIIWAATGPGSRCGIWMELMSVVGIMRFLQIHYGAFWSRYSRRSIILSVFLLGGAYLHLGFADCYVIRFRISFDKMTEWFIKDGEGSFFGDYKTLGTRPALCGYLPPYGLYTYNSQYFNQYYGIDIKDRRKYALIVPEELRMVSLGDGVLIEGGSEIRELDGYYFVTDNQEGHLFSYEDMVIPVSYDFGKGYSAGYCWAVPFRSEKDGNWYLWLIPWRGWYVSHFMDLKGLRVDR